LIPGRLKPVKDRILAYFKAGEFEKAIKILNSSAILLEASDIQPVLADCERMAAEALLRSDFIEARQRYHRREGLLALLNGGFDPKKLIPPVQMPEIYRGKILLVSIFGGVVDEVVCLRSNDVHHQDILRNTELAIQDLGLHGSQVRELGGASINCEPDGSVIIWGGSDEFGACDKHFAAMLIRLAYPNKTIAIQD
jgi:hypothetical protein